MFGACKSLTTLDVSDFSTSKVTNMEYMFINCTKLTTIGNISNWDTSNVTNMTKMFSSCWNLTTTITIRGTKCTSYEEMFYNGPYYSGHKITVNYTADASSLVNNMIATNSRGLAVKGSQVS